MTKKELSAYLGFETQCSVSTAYNKARKENPSIFKKYYGRSPAYETDLEPDEIAETCRYLGLNELQIELLKEELVMPEKRFIKRKSIYIDGNEGFVQELEKGKKLEACDNCVFIAGKSRAGKTDKLLPFCRFYNKFISRMTVVRDGVEDSVNIFEDKCSSWIGGEPKMFLK